MDDLPATSAEQQTESVSWGDGGTAHQVGAFLALQLEDDSVRADVWKECAGGVPMPAQEPPSADWGGVLRDIACAPKSGMAESATYGQFSNYATTVLGVDQAIVPLLFYAIGMNKKARAQLLRELLRDPAVVRKIADVIKRLRFPGDTYPRVLTELFRHTTYGGEPLCADASPFGPLLRGETPGSVDAPVHSIDAVRHGKCLMEDQPCEAIEAFRRCAKCIAFVPTGKIARRLVVIIYGGDAWRPLYESMFPRDAKATTDNIAAYRDALPDMTPQDWFAVLDHLKTTSPDRLEEEMADALRQLCEPVNEALPKRCREETLHGQLCQLLTLHAPAWRDKWDHRWSMNPTVARSIADWKQGHPMLPACARATVLALCKEPAE